MTNSLHNNIIHSDSINYIFNSFIDHTIYNIDNNNIIKQEFNNHTIITYKLHIGHIIYASLTDMKLLSRGLGFRATNNFLSEICEVKNTTINNTKIKSKQIYNISDHMEDNVFTKLD